MMVDMTVTKRVDAWPLYFAKESLDALRIKLKAGQVFPMQDKFIIRGYGRAYGVPDADRVSFGDLPYVQVLNVGTEDLARQIVERNLTFKDAKKLVGQGGS